MGYFYWRCLLFYCYFSTAKIYGATSAPLWPVFFFYFGAYYFSAFHFWARSFYFCCFCFGPKIKDIAPIIYIIISGGIYFVTALFIFGSAAVALIFLPGVCFIILFYYFARLEKYA